MAVIAHFSDSERNVYKYVYIHSYTVKQLGKKEDNDYADR